VGRLAGGEFPELIPAYYVWEELFRTAHSAHLGSSSASLVLATALELDRNATDSLVAVSSAASVRASALRAASPSADVPGLSLDREIAAAEQILEARDELIRELPKATFDRLRAWVDVRRRQTTFSFQPRGRLLTTDLGGTRCQVSVKGKEYPHLIPEGFYWEFYMRGLSLSAREYRAGRGGYAPEYIETLRRYHLPILEEHIQLLLNVSSQTIVRVDNLRTGADYTQEGRGRQLDIEVADLVADARAELVRQLPRAAWAAIQRDASTRSRASTVFDFPPSF
jgi:hypothetical protein